MVKIFVLVLYFVGFWHNHGNSPSIEEFVCRQFWLIPSNHPFISITWVVGFRVSCLLKSSYKTLFFFFLSWEIINRFCVGGFKHGQFNSIRVRWNICRKRLESLNSGKCLSILKFSFQCNFGKTVIFIWLKCSHIREG